MTYTENPTTTTDPGGTAPTATNVPANWLVARRNAGATPAEITSELVEQGWSADQAARWSLRSLRSSDRHRLLYAGLTIGSGIAALSTATALHLGLEGNTEPQRLAEALTVAVTATPIAAYCFTSMNRLEAKSRHAVWSPSRRVWFGALALCSGLVGVVRLLAWLYLAIASLTGASAEPLLLADVAQVAVTVGIALPLYWWSMTEWRRSAVLVSGLAETTDPDD